MQLGYDYFRCLSKSLFIVFRPKLLTALLNKPYTNKQTIYLSFYTHFTPKGIVIVILGAVSDKGVSSTQSDLSQSVLFLFIPKNNSQLQQITKD
jgi:hypothetical protein